MRWTWVSTTTPVALPNQVPRTTLAVLRAAPGSVSRSSMLPGTSPSKRSTMPLAAPIKDPRLVAEKAGGLDQLFHIRLCRHGHGGRARELTEESGRHHIHALVRALRGEDRGGEQLPGVAVVELAGDVAVVTVQPTQDKADALLAFLGRPGPRDFLLSRHSSDPIVLNEREQDGADPGGRADR